MDGNIATKSPASETLKMSSVEPLVTGVVGGGGMSENLDQPLIIQRQYDLQYDVLTNLLSVSDDVISDEALRQKIVELKRLSMEIQMAPPEALAPQAPAADQGADIWGVILEELLKKGAEIATGWLRPGSEIALYNATDNAIFVRTFDQGDPVRWIAYGSWTIQPRTYATVAARGQDNIQVDIGGRVYRCGLGLNVAYAFNGNTVIRRP